MYSEKWPAIRERATAGTQDLSLTAVANEPFEKICLSQFSIRRLGVQILTAVVSTGVVIVTFWKRVTPGSDVGRVAIGTVQIAAAQGIGMVWKDADDVVIAPGQSVIASVTTAAAGGGNAGNCLPVFEPYDNPEAPANQTNMVEDTTGVNLTP